MKKCSLLSVVILLSGFSCVFGQTDEPEKIKKTNPSEVYVQTGLFLASSTNGSLADFKTLAPESVLLNKDFTGYSSNGGFTLSGYNSFSAMLGFQIGNQQKTAYKSNPRLRLGVNYFIVTSTSGNLSRTDRNTLDTLPSTQSAGQVIYVDSVTMTNADMRYSSEQLRLDGSLIFSTNPEARWSLFAGIGITAGVSLNAYTDINYSEFHRRESRDPIDNSSPFAASFFEYNGQSERFNNKTNFGLSTYLPMGVDFRVGNKRAFWKQMHLFYELRPGVNMTYIPELRTVFNASAQHGLGLKVAWL